MRNRDVEKQEAIIRATVKLVNEIGFVSSSVAKIAKEANVSPATLYIYYENKEDLIISTYKDIKKRLSAAMGKGIDSVTTVKEKLRKIWGNAFEFILSHRLEMRYSEQLANSPYVDLISYDEVTQYFTPLLKVVEDGIKQGVIKNVKPELLGTFIFHPILTITNAKMCQMLSIDNDLINISFEMAWDAIKV